MNSANPFAFLAVAGAVFSNAALLRGADSPPRKVVIGTAMYPIYEFRGQEQRLRDVESLIDEMAAAAKRQYPGDGLDLVVLPEEVLTLGSGRSPAERALAADGPEMERIRAKAREHRSYVVAPLTLADDRPRGRYSNAAILLDRDGKQVGVYRKVHPVAPYDSDVLEGGIQPGSDFPVFQCDFGKVGIQICWDMAYEDGWQTLAERGAEIVALPTASPQTARPAAYALRGSYYVVSSTPRDNASVFNSLGRISAQTTSPGVAVHQIDLSYALLHWSPTLDNGQILKSRYGDDVDFVYYETEDTGIFWSNAATIPISQMVRETGQTPLADHVQRVGRLQDAARQAAHGH
jgi:predicted amidohydrolase